MWLLTGNFGKPGGQYIPTAIVPLLRNEPGRVDGPRAASPVIGAPIIGGLMPCNVIPEEILTDHPEALPRAARGVRQPGALARRQPAHA